MTCAVCAVALLAGTAYADQPPRIPRIGVLMAPVTPMEEGLRQGLRELGYTEGKSIAIEWRRSIGTREELRLLATSLIQSKVDLIVAVGTAATRVAMESTKTVPDVFFEQTATIKLVVNLKTAKVLGQTIPESFLLCADEVIR